MIIKHYLCCYNQLIQNMRRVLYPFVIVCLILCSCKNRSSQNQSTPVPAKAPVATPAKPLAATILEFYKAYCANWDGESKTDSILSMYCTQELKDYVMDCVGEYDFVLNGGIYADIHPESFCVVKRNEKFIVYYEYTKWPVSDEPGKDSLYVMTDKENRISYIIRISDNYRIPNANNSKAPNLYYYPDHEYVDLGLSVYWADRNIGAYSLEWHGDYFAWGETSKRDNYVQNYYLEPKESHYFDGKLSVLEPNDDAASVLWGEEWRLPTKEEFQELIDRCSWEWTTQNYTKGYKVTAENGNSIFLPVGGMKMDTRWLNSQEGLYYWTASCLFNDPERETKAWMFCSVADGPSADISRRTEVALTPLSIPTGRLIRPVSTKTFVPISDIVLNRKKLDLEIGDEYILTASFIPADATKKSIYWRSGNSAVAYVDRNGKVTAVSNGKCTITALCEDIRKECQVTVVMPKDYIPAESEEPVTIYAFGGEVNKEYVDDFWNYDDTDEELEEVFTTQIGNNSDRINVTLYGYTSEDWKNDPGDFSVISIESAGKQYRFKNPDWITSSRFDNGYFYVLPIGKSRYLLFFKGWGDCCTPGILTILAVDETGVKTVLNKEYDLSEINKEPFSMTLEDNYREFVSIKETYYPNACNLYIEDGALKMRKVLLLHE